MDDTNKHKDTNESPANGAPLTESDSGTAESSKEATASATVPEATTSAAVTQSETSKGGKIALAIVFVLIAGALVWAGISQTSDDEGAETGASDISFDSEAPLPTFEDVPEVVATVNGQEVLREDYVAAYTQAFQVSTQQGVATGDPSVQAEIEAQALDILVNTELLAQAAASAEVTVDETQVAAEIESYLSQLGGEEGLEQALSQAGVTREDFEQSIREQFLVEAYLANTPELGPDYIVSNEEIQARYDEVASQGVDLPQLEDVREDIVAQLESEYEQLQTQAVLDRLRSAAEVETFVGGE